jgi:hypothetical protein
MNDGASELSERLARALADHAGGDAGAAGAAGPEGRFSTELFERYQRLRCPSPFRL